MLGLERNEMVEPAARELGLALDDHDRQTVAVEQLRSLVQTITDTSVQVASSAQETQATAMHLAEAAEHQAQEISSASDRISEIAASIDQVCTIRLLW